MVRRLTAASVFLAIVTSGQAAAQSSTPSTPTSQAANVDAPLPAPAGLLAEVEQNQRRMEALERDYTYHVHTEQQQLDGHGGVKKTETEDAESLTVNGVRVDRVTARNGKPLTPSEQAKENERIDKEVAHARERIDKAAAKEQTTDAAGHPVLTLSRILELGTFSNPQRVSWNGRPTITLQYAGNPAAKTHSSFEAVFRDLRGTVWVDEADRIIVQGEGQFQNDFKLGGGLVADVRKGTHFAFRATRISDGIWLPAAIDGEGSLRLLLFVHLNGRLHLTTSDYRRFRASATIVGSHGAIDENGQPLPTQPAAPPSDGGGVPAPTTPR